MVAQPFGIGLLVLLTAGCSTATKVELPPEKDAVLQAVNSHVGDVSDCYTAALKKNPKLSGKLILEWEINPIGDAKNVKVIQSVEPKLDQCIAKKLVNWAFTPPPDNKIAKVRYPFVFAPVVDPIAKLKTKTMETVATPPPATFKRCSQIEAEYAALCVREEESGECILDEKQMGELLNLLRSSPKLPMAYLADIDKMLKNPKPSTQEGQTIIGKLAEDCWTTIHMGIWKSILHTFKNVPTHSRQAEAKEVLGERTTGLEVHSPTLLALNQDLAILDKAVESGFIKLSAGAKKDFNYIHVLAKKVPGATETSDTAKLVAMIRKELKAVKPVRTSLKEWSKKNWKKL